MSQITINDFLQRNHVFVECYMNWGGKGPIERTYFGFKVLKMKVFIDWFLFSKTTWKCSEKSISGMIFFGGYCFRSAVMNENLDEERNPVL
jgi:hypothetical protein